MSHTPTPWTVSNVSGAGWEIRGTLPCVLVACERWVQFETKQWHEMQADNAAFIVRAVNSHDELVAACEAAKKLMYHDVVTREETDRVVEQLTAALTKARG